MKLKLPQPARGGRVVLELKAVSKRYGSKEVFSKANLLVERGDRISLVGPNGAGKSTMMRLLSGVEPPDSGERKLGHKVEVSFFSQERTFNLRENMTVLENMLDAAPVSVGSQLRNILGAFLFHGDDADKKAKVLSGGEKSRLALAKMLLQPTNVLLLDEPTNHLDIDSKEVLLEALASYTGTVVFVSHDRYFIDRLATKVVEVGDGTAQLYWGNYEDYLRAKPEPTPAADSKPAEPASSPSERSPRRNGTSKNRARQQRHELEQLEESITEAETAVASLEGRMSVPGFYDDADAAAEIVATHQKLKGELEQLYKQWDGLAATQEKAR
jgi:ATP-binding cassette subfamily F protein 3